jgi:hypothetical protein
MLLLLLTVMTAVAAPAAPAAPAASAAPPSAAVAYAFEVQALDLGRNDDAIEAYGFSPVGAAPLLTHGIRGTLTWDSGLSLGLNMRSATASREGETTLPTFVQATWTGVEIAGPIAGPVRAGGDVGFLAVSQAVSSTVQGGALVYLGPFLQPRVTARLLDGPSVVELALGWMFQTPLGSAHQNPLWEESFDRNLIQGPTLAVHSGMGTRGNR